MLALVAVMSTAVAVVASAVVVVVVVAIGSMMCLCQARFTLFFCDVGPVFFALCACCIRLVRTIGMCLCRGRPRAL